MSGISNIIEIINAKTVKKEEEIISEAERHKKIKLEEAKRRADEKASTITMKAELQAKSELSRYEASAKLKSKYRMLEAKNELINEVLTTVEKQMESIVGKAEYKKVLARLIVDGCKAMSEEKLDEFLKTGKDWGRLATSVPGIYIQKPLRTQLGYIVPQGASGYFINKLHQGHIPHLVLALNNGSQ